MLRITPFLKSCDYSITIHVHVLVAIVTVVVSLGIVWIIIDYTCICTCTVGCVVIISGVPQEVSISVSLLINGGFALLREFHVIIFLQLKVLNALSNHVTLQKQISKFNTVATNHHHIAVSLLSNNNNNNNNNNNCLQGYKTCLEYLAKEM